MPGCQTNPPRCPNWITRGIVEAFVTVRQTLTQDLLRLGVLLDGRGDLLPSRRDPLELGEAEDGRRRAAVGHLGGVASVVQPLDDVRAV